MIRLCWFYLVGAFFSKAGRSLMGSFLPAPALAPGKVEVFEGINVLAKRWALKWQVTCWPASASSSGTLSSNFLPTSPYLPGHSHCWMKTSWRQYIKGDQYISWEQDEENVNRNTIIIITSLLILLLREVWGVAGSLRLVLHNLSRKLLFLPSKCCMRDDADVTLTGLQSCSCSPVKRWQEGWFSF